MIARQGSVSGSLDGCTINAANDRILRYSLDSRLSDEFCMDQAMRRSLTFFFSSRG